jgi:tripartite-type tricarboxylate transporter receptor subunit TctC
LSILVSFFSVGSAVNAFPTKPIELICSTKAGSGAAAWCEMMAIEMSQKGRLGVPITVLYKPGGANHEGVVYTDSKKK